MWAIAALLESHLNASLRDLYYLYIITQLLYNIHIFKEGFNKIFINKHHIQSCPSHTSSFLVVELRVLFKACFRGSNILQFQPFKTEERKSVSFVITTAVVGVYLVNRPLLSQGFKQMPQLGFLMSANWLPDSKWKLGISEYFNLFVNKSKIVVSWGENTSKYYVQCILLNVSIKFP